MKFSKLIKNKIKSVLNRLPYIKTLHELNANSKFPAGHYYSTVVSLDEIKKRQKEIWKPVVDKKIPGIDLRVNAQLELLKTLSVYYLEMPFKAEKQEGFRYNFFNRYYEYTDGIILYSLIRHFRPSQIIEIGSGYSSALMLDTSELFFDSSINLTFIEPYSNVRLKNLLKETDSQTNIIESDVQLLDTSLFEKLESGDILFVDSSHAVKTGSDVNYILFEILPKLKKGVLIHFHDIHYPFEYPKEWVLNGFGWNETYFLKAFLMNNSSFEILLFSDYLLKFYKKNFSKMPLCDEGSGSSLWLIKK